MRYNHRSVECPLYKATLKHWGKEKNAPGLGDVHAYYAKHQMDIDKAYWAGIDASEAVLECDDVSVGSGVRLFQRSTEERDRPQTSSKKPKPNSQRAARGALGKEMLEEISSDHHILLHTPSLDKSVDAEQDIREYIASISLDHQLMAGAGKYCLIHCAEDHNTSECRALDKARHRCKGELGGDTAGPFGRPDTWGYGSR